jgi:hypothetical protein
MAVIRNWRDIEDQFAGTLLLGNGASIAIDSCFSYASLLESAEAGGYITPDLRAIFDYLRTHDFELVMSMVRTAFHVNEALGIADPKTRRAYRDIRTALVTTVRAVHPSYDSVTGALPALHRFMRPFDTVLSLNYDLTVYWAMLEGNRAYGNWFKDCFVRGVFDDEWERMREPYQASGTTLVFYPHGNLALATSITGAESKISVERDWDRLLGTILSMWEEGEKLPLFVSEGESEQKHSAVMRSAYLSTVYNAVMSDLGHSVVVFGCSLGEADEHILRRISKAKSIAKSVFIDGRSHREIEKECSDFAYRIQRYNPAAIVVYFDATSPGCWVAA